VSHSSRLTLALVVALLAAGCGQQQSPQRRAVADYVKRVSVIEAALGAPLGQVTAGGTEFSRETHPATNGASAQLLPQTPPEQTLERALTRIETLRGRLAAITAPPPAEHLRSLLLGLIDGQAAMTRELAELVAFLPRYNAALATLGPATRRLEIALTQRTAYGATAVSAVYRAKATALRRFQTETGAVLRELRRLRPPPVSRPGYAAELASLEGMGVSAGRLAAVLASGALSNVGPLLVQFDRAAASSNSVGVQRAEIAAARAYDARATALDSLSEKVEVERSRLADGLQ
jgi:hypothetical protein